MKVLFIVPYPREGASTRYRVEQFLPYLEERGVKCTLRPFICPGFYKILYKKNRYIKKLLYFSICCTKRLSDIFRALGYDIIFIHLEAFPFGPPLIEYFWAWCGKKIIFDLDDAIYMRNSSSANRIFSFLKCPSKIPKIIRLSECVIACNSYLKNYARQFIDENKIFVIHTSINTERFVPSCDKPNNKKIVIGWIGSHSTAIYLGQIKSVFTELAKKHDFILRIIGAGAKIEIPKVNIENVEWNLDNDVQNFQNLDIGIYPLIENEWIKGKTGFKTIQYMSVGIPCVVSDLGSNKDIISDGIDGFLARTDEDWFNKLSMLIENQNLRQKIGAAGRQTAQERYSLKINAPKILSILNVV